MYEKSLGILFDLPGVGTDANQNAINLVASRAIATVVDTAESIKVSKTLAIAFLRHGSLVMRPGYSSCFIYT